MAHLVNATSTRVGWTQSWCDVWFGPKLNYSDYLHACLRIRFFLVYIYFAKKLDRRGLIFSHFNLTKFFRSMQIDIFYYDSVFQSNFDEYVASFYNSYDILEAKARRAIFTNNDEADTRKTHENTAKWLALILFIHICGIKLNSKKLKKVFVSLILSIKHKTYSHITILEYLKFKYWRRFRGHLSRIIVFCFGYIDFLKAKGNLSPELNELMMIYFAIHSYRLFNKYWGWAASLLSFFFEYLLTNFKNIKITFYLISNDEVRAFFMARFLAKKFSQNQRVKPVINPLKRELRYLLTSSRPTTYGEYHKDFHLFVDNQTNKLYLKSLWKFYLKSFKINYDYLNIKSFKINNIWISLDLILIISWFNKNFNKELELFGYFFENRSLFLCLFLYKIFKFIDPITLYSQKVSDFKHDCYNTLYYNFLKPAFYDLYINNFTLFEGDLISLKYLSNFKYMNNNLNQLFNYYYVTYGYQACWIDNVHINSIKERSKTLRLTSYRGFKIQCLGRFSRKQRASSYWFSMGKVPLNTFSKIIDYGFYSLPVRNSAISVKVWIYHTEEKIEYEGLQLNY